MLLIPIKCKSCNLEFCTGMKEGETSVEIVCPTCGVKGTMTAIEVMQYTYCRTCKMQGINVPGNTICGNCGSSDTFLVKEVTDTDEFPLDETPAQASTAAEINAMVEERNKRLLKSKYCTLHKDVCEPDAAGFGACGDFVETCSWTSDENIEDETKIR